MAKNGGHSALVYRDALQKTHGSSNMLSCLYLCIHVYSLDVNGNAEFNVYIYIYILYIDVEIIGTGVAVIIRDSKKFPN